jgi:hypothetical protein
MTLDSEYSYGTIAAVNTLFGVINFIVLALPSDWRLLADQIPPDVDKIFRKENIKWASEGKASSIARCPVAPVEIVVRVVEGDKVKGSNHNFTINGHAANYRLRRVKKGILRRKVFEEIEISFYCAETNRTIWISLASMALHDRVDNVLKALSKSSCH